MKKVEKKEASDPAKHYPTNEGTFIPILILGAGQSQEHYSRFNEQKRLAKK